MNTSILYNTKAGRKHTFENKPNQDYVKVYEDQEIVCISVNDGCSGCKFPLEAAKINSSVAEKVARNPVIWTMPQMKFKKLFISEYNRAFCESGLPYDELCSTTAIIIVSKTRSMFIAFSIGDSGVLSYDSDLNISVLLEPKNGLRKSSTFFTNTDEFILKKMAQYRMGVLTDTVIAGFIIFSDGAESIMVPPYNAAQQLVCSSLLSSSSKREDDIRNLVEQLRDVTSDDVSIAIFSNVTDKLKEAARAVYNGPVIEEIINNKEGEINLEEITKTKTKSFEKDDSKFKTKVYDANEKKQCKYSEVDNMTKSIQNKKTAYECQMSDLLDFLAVPRSANDILHSGYIHESEFLVKMMPLIKEGIIKLNNNNTFVVI